LRSAVAGGKPAPSSAAAAGQPVDEAIGSGKFFPKPPQTVAEAALPQTLAEALLFKALLAGGNMTSREVARATALPGKPVLDMLAALKMRQLVHYKDSASMGDFEYALTEAGRDRARAYMKQCAYVGPAPVTLESYIDSVKAQALSLVRAKQADLRRAFGDLLLDEGMFRRLGPAINSGRGLFLYGRSGNGKTSVAERITDCFGDTVWIPYTIFCGGEIITLFDPETHVPADEETPPNVDPRWVRIRRPTIVVGGELTMEALELCHNRDTNISEASLQLKSNTGTLVIDDFGRQRVSPIDLLNRWIVPLEKRRDYLALANGRKVCVPFEQLIIFATNLEPKDLVDEAFLRRIPSKINITDPDEGEFRKLFDILAPRLQVEMRPGSVDHLVEKHYKAVGRPFRCCHPRDLLLQILNAAAYNDDAPVATPEAFDAACENYFAVL
jgi:predicted ATPase with chaperone activity